MTDSNGWTIREVEERAAAGDPEALRLQTEFAHDVVTSLAPLLDGSTPPRFRDPAVEQVRAIQAADNEIARARASEKRAAVRRDRMMLALTALAILVSIVLALPH